MAAQRQAESQPLQRMTYAEFLDWGDEDTLAEWVDGAVVMTSPASDRHQMIVEFLIAVLGRYVRLRHLGRMHVAPFQMKLPHSGREPDVLFIAAAHLGRLRATYLDGPADLVVEIVSPESADRDYRIKLAEYQTAGVPEYWLVDADAQRAHFYQLDAQGVYQLAAPDREGKYHSVALPGCWLRLAWLWPDPMPAVETVLLDVAGEDYARSLRNLLSQHEQTSGAE